MDRRFIAALGLLAACSAAHSQDHIAQHAQPSTAPDPTVSDGDKYRVLFENESVRVLRYHDEPGQRTHMHHHPHAFLMYALAPFRRQLTFPDGKRVERVFAADEIAWVPAQTHLGENIGSGPTDGLIIELKSRTR